MGNRGRSHNKTKSSKHPAREVELIKSHENINRLFRQVETAKKEWEKTMDCVGDMIILTDDEGRIKRVNRIVKAFTKKPYREIIGKYWEDLIVEHGLEATTLYAGCTELVHKPSSRWFELNAYPFDDIDLGYAGNVLIIHEITELKIVTDQLEKTSREMSERRNRLQTALDKISLLFQRIIQKKDLSTRFPNPNLKKCHEVKNCSNVNCLCFGKEAMRCWQIAGTYCNGKTQGVFAQKYGSCSKCKVFTDATSDPIYKIGEHFNNMMHMLENIAQEAAANTHT